MADEFAGFDTTEIEIEDPEDNEILDVITPKYDFENERIIINSIGQVETGNEVDAYRIWVAKCLLTERYKYLAYSTDYGIEFEEIIRSDYPRDIAQSEIERTVQEALQVDSRTLSVSDFTFEWEGENISVRFTVESIYSSDIYELMKGGDEIGSVRVSAT